MKSEFDKKLLKICLYAFVTLAALLVFSLLLLAWKSVWNVISFLLELLSPFIISIIIAYILSPAVTALEKLFSKIFKKEGHAKGRKLSALIIVYVLTVALIVLTIAYIVPGLVKNISDLVTNLPGYIDDINEFYKTTILTYPLFTGENVQKAINDQWVSLSGNLPNYMNGVLSGVTNFVLRFVSSVASFILGLVLSFYLLNEREHVFASFSRLMKARFGDRRSSSVMSVLTAMDRVFGRYISAKLLLALIMFAMCMVVFPILGVRYLVLMSAIVGLSTLVPYIGPFVGAVPPIVVSLIDNPQKGIAVTVAIIAIHAVDNYFMEPAIFSERMGLSPFWILLSIIVGGGLFGFWGVLLSVPAASVIKLLIVRYIRGRQLKHRRDQTAKEKGGAEAPPQE